MRLKKDRAARQRILDVIGAGELYTRQIAAEVDRTERTVAQMLQAMEKDEVVVRRVPKSNFGRKTLWKASGKPVPDEPTATCDRKIRAQRKPVFSFAALLAVGK